MLFQQSSRLVVEQRRARTAGWEVAQLPRNSLGDLLEGG